MALFVWLAFASVIILWLLYAFLRAVLNKIEIDFITERYVFITGCDSGFGNLLARTLDAKGVKVIAGCLKKQGSTELQDECSSRLVTILIEITDKESVQNAVNSVKTIVGQNGLYGLVNNAGVMPYYGPAEMTTKEEYEKVCNINLLGTISVTLSFLPLLRESRGRLVTVCSVTSSCPIPGVANYGVTKAGIKMFSGCLRRELRGSGMKIATIEPGGFETSITDDERLLSALKSSYKRANSELQEYYGGQIANSIMWGIRNVTRTRLFRNNPKMVIDVITHALFARFPKRRYLVGLDAKYLFRPLMYGPDWLSDFILSWPAPYGKKEHALNL